MLLGLVACGVCAGPRARGAWHLDGEVLTDQPVDVGGKLWLDMPGRVHVNTSVGYVPTSDIDALNRVLVGFGAYNAQTASLIRSGLGSSIVWRTHLGWQPWREHGFYLDVGYGLFTFGGHATNRQLIEAATGQPAPPDPSNDNGYTLQSTLHMVDAEMGWRWHVAGRLGIRAAVGFAGTVAASSTVKPNFVPQDPQRMQQYTRIAGTVLDDVYTTYVFTPTVSLAAGFRFF